MRKGKVFLSIVGLSLVLSACSFPGLTGGVKTAEDIVANFNKLKTEVNYHLNMGMNLEMSVKASGLTMDIPVAMQIDADVLDDKMHGNMNVTGEFMGMNLDSIQEMYVTGNTSYIKDSDTGYWVVSEDVDSSSLNVYNFNIKPETFKNAELIKHQKEGTYEVIQPFSEFLNDNSSIDAIGDMAGSMVDTFGADKKAILDAWSDASVIYVFDKDFYLSTITITGCNYSDTIEQDGISADLTMIFDMSFAFSRYGDIKDSEVSVPQSVIDKAVPEDDSFGGYDSDDSFLIDIEDEDTFGTIDDIGIISSDESSVETDESDVDSGFTVGSDFTGNRIEGADLYGSYNGIPLTGTGDSWEATFGSDGWSLIEDDEYTYSFQCAENPKYGDADLYVYNEARDNTTSEDILSKGIYGYDIDVSYAKSYPNMTWNGITFGATADDIKAVYGEPSYIYEGELYTIYSFELSDTAEIEFYVYPNGGLKEVNLWLD